MSQKAGLDITHGPSKLSSRSSSTAYTATSSPSTTSSGTSTTKRKATRWHPCSHGHFCGRRRAYAVLCERMERLVVHS